MEEGDGEEVCLELIDLLLQGLPLPFGWGMAVEEEDDDKDDEGFRAEVATGMLVEELTVTADDGACSVIAEGCKLMPSEESAPERETFLLNNKIGRYRLGGKVTQTEDLGERGETRC